MKDFDTWNGFKKAIHEAEGKLYKQWDIWWCSLGEINGRPASAIISQVRLVDTRRFVDKIGMLDKEKFEEMKNAVKGLL